MIVKDPINDKMVNMIEIAQDQIFAGVPAAERAIATIIAQRYGLDPVLKHVQPIKFKGKFQNYITKAGLLHIAHQSGELDGFEFEMKSDKNPITGKEDISCLCRVFRKDMGHPISSKVWLSEYRKINSSGKKGPWDTHTNEMLKKVALVSALRMAFDVSIPAVEEMDRVFEREDTIMVKAIPKKEIQKYPESLEMYQEYCKKEPKKWNLLLDAVTDYCKDGEIRIPKGESPFLYCSPEQVKDFIEIIG